MEKYSKKIRQGTWDLSSASSNVLEDALGYSQAHGQHDDCKAAHIKYIKSQSPSPREGLEEFIAFFADTIWAFRVTGVESPNIQVYITNLVSNISHPYFKHLRPGLQRERDITDIVLLILGIWLFMKGYFICPPSSQRRAILAFCQNNGNRRTYDPAFALDRPLASLITGSFLLPFSTERYMDHSQSGQSEGNAAALTPASTSITNSPPSSISSPNIGGSGQPELSFGYHAPTDVMESLAIDAKSLNAVRLANLGAVQIHWTDNISRHLLLSKHGLIYSLELFALPHILQGSARAGLQAGGIPTNVMTEIEWSYGNLFNPVESPHSFLGRWIGVKFWCPCLSCSSGRLREREIRKLKKLPIFHYSESFRLLLTRDLREWDQGVFPRTWPRIRVLEAHLAKARPWSFWVIFRDRRDTVQFWTFLFGTFVLFLAIDQVGLGAAQVYGSFNS